MSATVARAIAASARLLTWPLKPWRRRAAQALAAELLELDLDVQTARGSLRFHCPTRESLHFVREFSFREPETLTWIDSFQPGDVFWDIGANVGQYSLYAALAPGVRTLAFEPGAASYSALIRNIEINRMDDRIAAYCVGFGEATELSTLNMARTDAGSSMHAIGVDTDSLGRTINVRFRQAVSVYSMDGFLTTFAAPFPTHIKLDVDSIEEKIVAGARQTLADRRLQSMMVEIEGGLDTPRARAIVDMLRLAGLSHPPDAARSTNVLFRRL
ncbi:MAG: FkbM family methyltransferase [Alphaproteobacteria bacterium]|nr:FkbM family methyltransferase [Alphaproteobacteria bacterium]